VTLSGRVITSAGQPISGATVAVYRTGLHHAAGLVATTPDGTFRIVIDKGMYAVTVTAPGWAAGIVAEQDVGQGMAPLTLTLQAAKRTVRGTVRDEGGRALPNATVRAAQWTFPETRLFYTSADGGGHYEIGLEDDVYTLTVDAADLVSSDSAYAGGGDARVDLVAYPRRRVSQPAPQAVVDWIRSRAIPLRTVIAGTGFEDMRALKSVIGGARIVALGEATHGTREFIQVKHRLIEYLVTELGFSVFAIEASLPDAMAVNDYIVHGRGTAAVALAGMRFWITDTEEVLQMIEWMREYNASPAHARKLRFYGFDMQYTSAAATGVVDFIGQAAPQQRDKVAAAMEPFRTEAWQGTFADLASDVRLATRRRVEEVGSLLDQHRDDSEEWRRARRYVAVIVQAMDVVAPAAAQRGSARDRAMAENVEWIAENHPGERMILWAANGHISRLDAEGTRSMGSFLAARHGQDYLAVALAFGEGAFQGRNVRMGSQSAPVAELTVERAPDRYVEAALARAGMPLLAIGLRDIPRKGPVADWFATLHPMREFGSTFIPPDYHWEHMLIARHFDAIVYVDRTTRARPTPTGRRDK
jgi:erythromycin esterase